MKAKICLFLFLFFVCLSFSACRADPGQTQDETGIKPSSDIDIRIGDQTAGTETDIQTADTVLPVETEPLPVETEKPLPAFETVTDDYFQDALFIGDSHTDGLRICCPPGDAQIYAGTSMSVYSIMDSALTVDGCKGLRALLEERTFGKIYIMLGINEAGYAASSFLDTYRELLDEIRACQPNAVLYIQSILSVTAAFAEEQPIFAQSNLGERNKALAEFADGETVFYLNVNEALANRYGNLPASYSDDGVHLKAEYYSLWYDYLLSHAIVLN